MQAPIYKAIVDGNKQISSNRMSHTISEPVQLNIPTYDGSNEPIHPSVVYCPNKFNGYLYWMAFTPFPLGNDDFENPSIMASNDGLNWEIPTGVTNPLAPMPAEGFYADVTLVHKWDTNELFLYWSQFGVTPYKGWLLKSSDGINWGTPIEISRALGPASVEYIAEGQFVGQMINNGVGNVYNKTKGTSGIISMTSTDGIEWKTAEIRETTNLIGKIWHGSRMRGGAGYHYLMPVSRGTETFHYDLVLHYGFSPDGQNILCDTTPLMEVDHQNNDIRHWYAGCMIPTGNDTVRVYASARKTDQTWKIFYFDIRTNNPGYIYDNSPNVTWRRKEIFKKEQLRDLNAKNYTLSNETATSYFVGDLSSAKEKILIVDNTLQAADDTDVSVRIEIIGELEGDVLSNPFSFVKADGSPQVQSVTVNRQGFQHQIVSKEAMPILGMRIPSKRITFRIQAQGAKVPTKGTVSVILVTQ